MEKEVPERESPFATEPIGRLILKFAVPSVIALLVNSLYNIVDQIFIGWGVGNAVALVTVVSIVLAVVFLLFIDPILTLFGATDLLRSLALEYGFIIGLGLPFMMISAAINSMIRADGSPKYAMFSMIIGAVLNVILDPVFIFVFHMGVQGAAIATVIGQVASFVVSAVYLPWFKTVHPDAASFRLNGRTCGNILTFGLSSFITQFAITCDEGQPDHDCHSAGHRHRYPAHHRFQLRCQELQAGEKNPGNFPHRL
ncbi:MATE family efflux transporter [Flavonifractor sp. An112]|uniref:MATE family efflux transporter n=1 Tax=Flavonifractor sp. An112 TaxID=1965544 RepID=UPI00343CD8A8